MDEIFTSIKPKKHSLLSGVRSLTELLAKQDLQVGCVVLENEQGVEASKKDLRVEDYGH